MDASTRRTKDQPPDRYDLNQVYKPSETGSRVNGLDAGNFVVTKGNGLEDLNARQDLRGVVAAKPSLKPNLADRIALWFSTSRNIDGLWVGTMEDKPRPGLRRVEDALQLIKLHAPLHYSRVVRHLQRIWVRLEHTASAACYYHSMQACVLDERYVLQEATTVEEIAATIIHEATHARLERRGIQYLEYQRQRIEAVCIRRELNFIAKLAHVELLQEAREGALEWCTNGAQDFLSDSSFATRHEEGSVEALRYLGWPEWLIGFMLKAAARRRLLRQKKASMSAPEPPR